MFRKIASSIFSLVFVLLFSNLTAVAQDGKALFNSNCAACHNPIKDATGPALQGVDQRREKDWIYKWIKNPSAVIAAGDPHAKELVDKYKIVMTAFPNLTHEEIDAIIKYVDDYKAPGAEPAAAGQPAAEPAAAESNGWLYTFITVILLALVIVLWRANYGLRRVANEKEGLPNEKEVPFYRNKVVIAIVVILVFIFCGYWLTNGAIELGRQQNYQPEQPIFYSHKVHAGVNQINCLYCHAGAEKSRQAMVPSPNVCMNCHKQINEYTGKEKLVSAEGKEIDGTAEIQKLYKYAGWDPAKKEYIRDANGNIKDQPIAWTKIHNLPDHVYFNHSQHVKVGQVQCQRCHGDIQNMDEVYQFAPLSMGWCINCHRQTEVKFADNKYYSIFEKYHEEIKSGKRTGVTVNDIGGTECAKCHY
ncbi:MAG: c-type cytochrome [Bacteroidetes bacterium]|nr:c-type cytochrome [Bacteroidota bacterium]MBS1740877.1 c-type cytochrome [Bacteroidota bacterium]MBS1775819.1 c-type cytochrome [Bacteroidota bacterium]